MSRPVIYSDKIEHEKHIQFLKCRAQANFRGEKFELSIEEFFKLWPNNLWKKRGKKSTDYAMTRIDWNRPWSVDNVIILKRCDQVRDAIAKNYEKRHGKPLPRL